MKQALQDFNIEIETIDLLKKEPRSPAPLWSFINSSPSTNASLDLNTTTLPWEVRYQLEVCISQGYFNEYKIEEAFIKKLAEICSTDARKARNILEYVTEEKATQFYYEPMKLFTSDEAMSASYETDIPTYCAYSRKAQVTPTTIYFSSPSVETTNRVLRHYARENAEGRFLRVQFTDENGEVS